MLLFIGALGPKKRKERSDSMDFSAIWGWISDFFLNTLGLQAAWSWIANLFGGLLG